MSERLHHQYMLMVEIITLAREGYSQRDLARHLKVGRKTIRNLQKKYRQMRTAEYNALENAVKAKRKSKLEEWLPKIREWLDEFPEITAVRLKEELQAEGYDGGLTILQDKLREIRPKPVTEPVIRFETPPGKQGQMDWSPFRIPFSATGVGEVQCFSLVLGFSRRQYADWTESKELFTLLRRYRDAFHYFGGVPAELLHDNEKTMTLRWEAGRPIYNPAFLRFCIHYGTRPRACLPRRAKTKGKIEKIFQYLLKNLLNARRFRDLDELRSVTRWWLSNRSDLHRHDTTGRPPLELFQEQEAEALIPLPAHCYEICEVVYRVCGCDGTIEFQTNIYSVPFAYIGWILIIKASEHELTIYSPELAEIAVHERRPRGRGTKVEKEEHRLSQKDRYGLDPYRDTFLALGEHAEIFLQGLKAACPRRCGLVARCILALQQDYESSDIDKALAHGMRYHAYEVSAIEHILKAKAKPRRLESSRHRHFQKSLDTYPEIKQRNLSQYASLDRKRSQS
ncbi:MAG: IS21 family transposase [Gammaproteobacteria bacterium]|nr:IS21 family transposase [Gammaproteobacteria bacterium]